jgi:hypothetical protein
MRAAAGRERWETRIHKTILDFIIWVLLAAGLVGLGMALQKLFGGGSPEEYGILGIGGGFWLLSCAIAIRIRNKVA